MKAIEATLERADGEVVYLYIRKHGEQTFRLCRGKGGSVTVDTWDYKKLGLALNRFYYFIGFYIYEKGFTMTARPYV